MQQENSRIPPELILFVTEMERSDPAQTDYMMQSGSYLFTINTDSF